MSTTNFQFLEKEWPNIFDKVRKAEQRVATEPLSTANYCRLILEECLYIIYDREYLEFPNNDSLVNLLRTPAIKRIIPRHLLNELHLVRKTGNKAVHFGDKVTSSNALISIKHLYAFLKWFALNYSSKAPSLPGSFMEMHIPKEGSAKRKLKQISYEQEQERSKLQEQVQRLVQEKNKALSEAQQNEDALLIYREKERREKELLAQQKEQRKVPIVSEFTEKETQQQLIEVDLTEAGWEEFEDGRSHNYRVSIDSTKDDLIDYVLWNEDIPLAIIESRKASDDVELAKQQAFYHADALEKKYGHRPLIYYTNGYDIRLWDDHFYPTSRVVYGYHNKADLIRLVTRRDQAFSFIAITEEETDKLEQFEIRAIEFILKEYFHAKEQGVAGDHRKTLISLAAGTGFCGIVSGSIKTLRNHGLAARSVIVCTNRESKTILHKQLSQYFTENEIGLFYQDKELSNKFIELVTAADLIEAINTRFEQEERYYGVGFFDFLVFEEIHPSIFHQQQSLVSYFDGLMLGVTACPAESIDHSIYRLFESRDQEPGFELSYDDAIKESIVPYRSLNISTPFLREGIDYKKLSTEDQEEYQEALSNRGTKIPTSIDATALHNWLFNEDTIHTVLLDIVENAAFLEDGKTIGKTILYAANLKHASFIQKQYYALYPKKEANTVVVVSSEADRPTQQIAADFRANKNSTTRIVIAVNQLESYPIDQVLQIAFLYPVKSYGRFWKMLSMGSPPSINLLGKGKDKSHYLVFDACENFEFFGIKRNREYLLPNVPIAQLLFKERLEFVQELGASSSKTQQSLQHSILNELHETVVLLDRQLFEVDMRLKYADEYADRKRWDSLSLQDYAIINEFLYPLVLGTDPKTEEFDYLFVKRQRDVFHNREPLPDRPIELLEIGKDLLRKLSNKTIAKEEQAIRQLARKERLLGAKLLELDTIRRAVRPLAHYLEDDVIVPIYTDFIEPS